MLDKQNSVFDIMIAVFNRVIFTVVINRGYFFFLPPPSVKINND